jgi:glutathione synthase/RimK-type ligase-like ATP-grasp enzyme
MLVLLWGLSTEGPLAAVREELVRLDVPVLMVDQHAVLDTEVRLCVGRGLEGAIRIQDRWVDFGAVSAVYMRQYESRRVPAVAREGTDSAAWRHALAVDYVMASWSEMTPALVVNPIQAMATNGSKPYQLEQIRNLGFAVPETLITTDPSAVRDFWEQHGTVIYKSVSGTRSIVSLLRPEQAGRLADVSFCPTQFQRYVPGTDHRVHVVGDEVFACEVLSDADDYRYPGRHEVEVRACSLPQTVDDRCRLASAALKLPVAGIDLRRTPEGDWYCFEVNPSPAFTYYESRSGQPIGRAIARLLAAGSQGAPEFPETREANKEQQLSRNRNGEAIGSPLSTGCGRAHYNASKPARAPDLDGECV